MVQTTFQADSALAWLHALPDQELVLLYKHSPRCGISLVAGEEIERFARQEPTLPIVEIDVVRQRSLSQDLANVLGIRHASPQVILLRGAAPLWHTSHQRITAPVLSAQLLAARGAASPGV